MAYDYEQDPVLRRILSVIIDSISPQKVILFGSRARGDASPDSDYDICIIQENLGNEREISRKVHYRLLHEDINQTVDLVVAASETWDRKKNSIGYVYKSVSTDGVALYG